MRIIKEGEFLARTIEGISVGDCLVITENSGVYLFLHKYVTQEKKINDYEFSNELLSVYYSSGERLSDPKRGGIYRFDIETGMITFFQETNNDFDQIGKFKKIKNKVTGEVSYELKTKRRKGTAKTHIDKIEMGILSDGSNFRENSYFLEVGGEGQPTDKGIEEFILQLSDMVGKEIGGAYFSKDGTGKTTHMSIGLYKNNTYTETKSSGQVLWNRKYPDSKIEIYITGFFHTHPSGGNISVIDRTSASKLDKKSKEKRLEHVPTLHFFILTQPVNYGGTYKFPY